MGYLKDKMIQDESRGFSTERDLNICSEHFSDTDIETFINQHGSQGECSFCEEDDEERIVVSWDDLMDVIIYSIYYFYDDPANGLGYDSSEGGFLGRPVYDTFDLLENVLELEADYKIIEEIAGTINGDLWTGKDFYGPTHLEELHYSWQQFCDLIKYKVRYVFYDVIEQDSDFPDLSHKPVSILEDIGEYITELGLIKQLSADSLTMYRATQYDDKRKVESCIDIGPAPRNLASANRFSPEGIPMFYGAEDSNTAIKEIIDVSKPEEYISVGCFTPKRPLSLIDLRDIPIIGYFNTEKLDYVLPSRFLRSFVRTISQKIEDGNERIEYIPSQVVTEYFRHVLPKESGKAIDGIVYKSIQDPTKDCYVIFIDSGFCKDQDSEDGNTVLVLKKGSITKESVADILKRM